MSSASKELLLDQETGRASRGIGIPYLLALAAQLPMLAIYFSALWNRPHYQFFPIALVAVGVFTWMRWPRSEPQPFFASKLSGILFWFGIGLGAVGTLFAEPWFAAASAVVLLTSLFARTKDGEFPTRSLLALSLPLFVILSLPRNLDFRLITWLQLISANLSSWYLDLLNFKHYSPGTTLNFPDRSYEVERACSGVQSFFTLVFCATFIIVAFRRPFFRGLFLIVSAIFWAVLMNSLRIMIIPIADSVFGLDLKEGIEHELLGYVVMILAFLMLLSTDQLLEYLFGGKTIEGEDQRRRLVFRRNRIRPGEDDRVRQKPVSGLSRRAMIAGAGLMIIFGCFQITDVVRSMSHPEYRVRFFDNRVIVDVEPDCMPKTLTSQSELGQYRWELYRPERSDRSRGSDLGQRSDQWIYVSADQLVASISLDQPFPGWHELTTCYKNQGWQFASLRRRLTESLEIGDGESIEWTFVEVEMKHPDRLERGYLLFCFCDANGVPFDAPLEWDQLSSFFERAKNRLSYRIRSNLFRGQAYQIQLFSTFPDPVSDAQKDELRSQFFEARRILREALMRYRDADLQEDLS